MAANSRVREIAATVTAEYAVYGAAELCRKACAQAITQALREALGEPSEAMFKAFEADCPYVWRRTMDKSGYEVVKFNDDYSEVQVIAVFIERIAAEQLFNRLEFNWRFTAMAKQRLVEMTGEGT